MDDRLAGKAVGSGLVFQFALLHLRPIVGVLHPFRNFHNTGAALPVAAAVGHLAPKFIDVDAVFYCLEAEICPITGES